MANPNLRNVGSIYGRTNTLALTTTHTSVATNSASSGKIYKVNSLIISNVDGVNSADVSFAVLRSSVEYLLGKNIPVPAGSTLIAISKDTGIYLQEGDQLLVWASVSGDLTSVVSYEEIY